MITCPWCGTHYREFQTNCKNCGGTLPAQVSQPDSAAQLAPPPPAPRSISDLYVFKVLATDPAAIVALVFSIIGGVFTPVGMGTSFSGENLPLGLIFMGLGMTFLAVGGSFGVWSYKKARIVVNVLRSGEVALGEVTELSQDYNVRINGRYPWKIEYCFMFDSIRYTGSVSTLNPPADLQPGEPVYVLFLEDHPEQNAIYPHP
jgi:hypothetical protein